MKQSHTLLISSFAQRSEGTPDLDRKFLQNLPPAIAAGDSLQFDFSSLLLSGEMIVDKHGYEALKYHSNANFKRYFEQISALHDEGFVRLVDYALLTDDEKRLIQRATDTECVHAERWLPHIRNAILTWEDSRNEYAIAYGKDTVESHDSRPTFILQEYVLNHNAKWNENAHDAVRDIIFSNRVPRSREDKKVIQDVARILLDHVHTSMMLQKKYEASIFEWENYKSAFLEKSAAFFEDNKTFDNLKACRQLLEVVAPCQLQEVELTNVISLLKDRDIQIVRDAIPHISAFSKDELKDKMLTAANRSNVKFRRRQKFSFWGKIATAPLGLLPGGSLAGESLLAAGQYAAGEAIEASSGTKSRNRDDSLAQISCVLTKHLDR